MAAEPTPTSSRRTGQAPCVRLIGPGGIDSARLLDIVERNRPRLAAYFPGTCADVVSTEAAHAFLLGKQRREREGVEFYRGIGAAREASGELIGIVTLKHLDADLRRGEIAAFVDARSEGKGLVLQAVESMLEFCCHDLELDHVLMAIAAQNIRARRLADALDFRRANRANRRWAAPDGVVIDLEYWVRDL